MQIEIVEEVKGGIEADPSCPKCGARGVFLYQTCDMVDGFFTLIDVYRCLVCHPEWKLSDK